MSDNPQDRRHLRNACLETLAKDYPLEFRGMATDFMSKYYAVYQLRTLLEKHPALIDAESIHTVSGLLAGDEFEAQHQGFFLYREAAETLASFMMRAPETCLLDLSYDALKGSLASASGRKHRAIAGALGGLPFDRPGPAVNHRKLSDIPEMSWSAFLSANRFEIESQPAYVGRSLVARLKHGRRLLVCKMATAEDSAADLQKEALWMDYLGAACESFPVRFDIPEPVKTSSGHVFSLCDVPRSATPERRLHDKKYAIGFLVHEDYFVYPNASNGQKRLSTGTFEEVMCRNAWILGRLTSEGIIHGALIPLFHNRTQRNRRQDQGLYEWVRAGRLDRWLYSCEYPNLGLTGVRDFEHFDAFRDTGQKLYRLIGNHFLSLFLVTGSYFRNRDAALRGTDAGGQPADARFLFEPQALRDIVTGVFHRYYEAFVGRGYEGDIPMDMDLLIGRMIDEMGVDRHMEEILRVRDQEAMSPQAFRFFLLERGMPAAKIDSLNKGGAEIVLHSGPHLGGFNDTISLPELIECVGTMSALCIAGKYSNQRGSRPFSFAFDKGA